MRIIKIYKNNKKTQTHKNTNKKSYKIFLLKWKVYYLDMIMKRI